MRSHGTQSIGREWAIAVEWQRGALLVIAAATLWSVDAPRVVRAFSGLLAASLPSLHTAWSAGPVLLAWSAACLAVAAWCKRRGGWATAYSRKLFHLLIFGSAAGLHLTAGLPLVSLFGMTTTAVIGYALWRGPGDAAYEALARESDAPHRSYYIVASYLATLLGGVLSNLIAGPWALAGYLVCGLADAAGEPVGARWGRHWYTVPGVRGGRSSRRSVEGSAAVCTITLLAVAAAALVLAEGQRAAAVCAAMLVIAAVSTTVEAVSPHGWDNATMQVVPSLLAALLLTS